MDLLAHIHSFVGLFSPITLLLPRSVPNPDEDSEWLKRAADAVNCGPRTQKESVEVPSWVSKWAL